MFKNWPRLLIAIITPAVNFFSTNHTEFIIQCDVPSIDQPSRHQLGGRRNPGYLDPDLSPGEGHQWTSCNNTDHRDIQMSYIIIFLHRYDATASLYSLFMFLIWANCVNIYCLSLTNQILELTLANRDHSTSASLPRLLPSCQEIWIWVVRSIQWITIFLARADPRSTPTFFFRV